MSQWLSPFNLEKTVSFHSNDSFPVVQAKVIYEPRDFPGLISLHDAFYEDRMIGPYNVTPLRFFSKYGKVKFLLDLAFITVKIWRKK